MKKISIIGVGHIGKLLAHKLSDEFKITGTTTDPTKIISGCELITYRIGDEIPPELESDITILTTPPSSFKDNSLPKFKTNWIIYTSSISVYGNLKGEVSESTLPNPVTDSEKKQFEIEEEIKKFPHWTILRLGGLVSETRHPGKYLSGKTDLPAPHAPVNLVHHHDVCQIITKIIQEEKMNEVYNCVCDEHHSRQEFYTRYARKFDLKAPEFDLNSNETGKLVLNDKIKQHLDYKFTYSELIEKLP